MRSSPVVVGVVVVSLALSSSCFPLERSQGLGEGSVHVTVRDSAGAPVENAVVSVDASRRMATSNANGVVDLDGLLAGDYLIRIGVDDDGDGGFDRTAITSATLAVVPIASGPFTAPVDRLTSVVLDDVELDAVGTLSGTLDGCDVDLCRVIVFREVTVGEGRLVTGVVEATAAVGLDGAWGVTDIGAGDVKVAAFRWPRAASTEPLQQMIAANRDISDVAVADAVVTGGGETTVTLTLAAAPPSVTTSVELVGDVTVLERGGAQAFFVVPQSDALAVDPALDAALSDAASDVDVPLGVYNVDVQPAEGVGGTLLNVAGVPGVATVGPVLIAGAADAALLAIVTRCRTVDDRDDCDGDGVGADDCATAEVEGDGDDDGDGQPDCEEAPRCRGPGLGTDLDHDCLCEPSDPVPGCASNDPVDCVLDEAPVCPGVVGADP